MNWNDIRPELRKKLDPKHVKPAPRGKFGDYVDGYHVISEANRIFGEDGWSYEITRLQLVSEQTIEVPGKGPQARVGYLCTVKVFVGDTFKEGSAVGSGVGRPDTMADHHESAVKEAETDALKRALRSYGNTFGLALYDKDKSQVGIDIPPFNAVAARDRIKAKLEKATAPEEIDNIAKVEADDIKRLHDNDRPKFGEIKKAKDDALARINAEKETA